MSADEQNVLSQINRNPKNVFSGYNEFKLISKLTKEGFVKYLGGFEYQITDKGNAALNAAVENS